MRLISQQRICWQGLPYSTSQFLSTIEGLNRSKWITKLSHAYNTVHYITLFNIFEWVTACPVEPLFCAISVPFHPKTRLYIHVQRLEHTWIIYLLTFPSLYLSVLHYSVLPWLPCYAPGREPEGSLSGRVRVLPTVPEKKMLTSPVP